MSDEKTAINKKTTIVLTWHPNYIDEEHDHTVFLNESLNSIRMLIVELFPDAWYDDESDADYWYTEDNNELCCLRVAKVVE